LERVPTVGQLRTAEEEAALAVGSVGNNFIMWGSITSLAGNLKGALESLETDLDAVSTPDNSGANGRGYNPL